VTDQMATVSARQSIRPESEPHSQGLAPLKGFRSDVQALRGVAVLLVVLYHAQVVVPGGFIGVDVFFVISGFVIGRLLLAGFLSTGTMSFTTFYMRRARRLLPALGVTLAVVLLLAPLLAPVGASDVTSKTGIAAALFSANLYLYQVTAVGYFDAAAELNPLLHTWSLSIEEQFYFVIPALLLAVWRIGSRTRNRLAVLRLSVAVLFSVSFAACVAFSFTDSVGPLDGLRFAFFSPVTRAWEFAAGLALVVLPASWFGSRRLRTAAVVAGLTLTGVAAFAYSDATVFPGAAALLPVAGTALAIYGGTNPTVGANDPRHAALAPLIRLGDLSYSWYLWHWPLIVFAGAYWPTAGRLPLVAAAAFSLLPAWASYRLLEHRLRATPGTRGWPTVALAACCIAAPILSAAISRPLTAYTIDRTESPIRGQWSTSRQNGCHDRGRAAPDVQRCRWGNANSGTTVLLLGDSNADQLSETLIGAAQATEARLSISTKSGCPFIDVDLVDVEDDERRDRCRRDFERSRQSVADEQPDFVVIANSTDTYLTRESFAVRHPTTGRLAESVADRELAIEEGLRRTIRPLVANGIQVVLVEVPPKPLATGNEFNPSACSTLALLVEPTRCRYPAFEMRNGYTATANDVERRAAETAGATTWNFADEVCPNGLCSEPSGRPPVWRDENHLSVSTATALVPWATERLRQLLDDAAIN
jgi:peptidoglycan/LPS O-acetylase OafA/YrhL